MAKADCISGVRFLSAKNSLVCGHVTFQLESEDRQQDRPSYRVTFGDGMELCVCCDGKWGNTRRIERDAVIDILPPNMGWTWATFLFSFTSFGLGHDAGFDASETKQIELERQEQERTSGTLSDPLTVLRLVLDALPTKNKDWLDPVLEQAMRALTRK